MKAKVVSVQKKAEDESVGLDEKTESADENGGVSVEEPLTEEENIPEALHFARSDSGLRRLRLLAEGLDEAEEVHQMRRLPHRQRAPFCGQPWQRWPR